MSLSDKIMDSLPKTIYARDVEAFINELKDKCTWSSDEVVSHHWVKNVINKLAGDKLI